MSGVYHHQVLRLHLDVDARQGLKFSDLLTDQLSAKFFHEIMHFFQHVFTSDGASSSLLSWALHTNAEQLVRAVVVHPGYAGGSIYRYCLDHYHDLPESVQRIFDDELRYYYVAAYLYGGARVLDENLIEPPDKPWTVQVGEFSLTPTALKFPDGEVLDSVQIARPGVGTQLLGSWHIYESISTIMEKTEQFSDADKLSGWIYSLLEHESDIPEELLAYALFAKLSGSPRTDVFLIAAEAALQAGHLAAGKAILTHNGNSGHRLGLFAREYCRHSSSLAFSTFAAAEKTYRDFLRLGGALDSAESQVLRSFSKRLSEALRPHPLDRYLKELLRLRATAPGMPFFLGFADQQDYAVDIFNTVLSRNLLPLMTFPGGQSVRNPRHRRFIDLFAMTMLVSSLFREGSFGCDVKHVSRSACSGNCAEGLDLGKCVTGRLFRKRKMGLGLRTDPSIANPGFWSPMLVPLTVRDIGNAVNAIAGVRAVHT